MVIVEWEKFIDACCEKRKLGNRSIAAGSRSEPFDQGPCEFPFFSFFELRLLAELG